MNEEARAGAAPLDDLRNVVDTIWIISPSENLVEILRDTMTPEWEGTSRPYSALCQDYIDHFLYPPDLGRWESSLSQRALEELCASGTLQQDFDMRFRSGQFGFEWHEAHLNVLEGGEKTPDRVLLTSRYVNAERRSAIVERAVRTEYDYVVYIEADKNSYVMYASNDETGTPLPPVASNDYEREVAAFHRQYVPEEAQDSLTWQLSIENVGRHLREDGEYVTYCTVLEKGVRRDKKLRFSYFDRVRNIWLLTRTDITEIRDAVRQTEQLQQALETAEKRADAAYGLLDAIAVGVIIVRLYPDGSARPEYGNLGMYRILRIPRTAENAVVPDRESASLEGAYFDDFFANIPQPDYERVRREYAQGYEKEHFTVRQYRLLRGDGDYAWVSAELSLQQARPGYRVYYATYADMSEEHALQEGLMKSLAQEKKTSAELEQASRAKTEFLSRMSHEIRTPMNAIIGLNAIATAHLDDRARIEDCLAKIGVSSRHLLSIINDVLDMSKISAGKMALSSEPFLLQQLLSNVISIIQPRCEERGLRLTVVDEVTEKAVLGDRTRVGQILLNLLSNAVKFTPEGGEICLSVEQLDRAGDKVRLRFVVRDTGIGMSEEFQKKLFEPFEQADAFLSRQYSGTGLGMAISRSLVTLMGGEIQVRSAPGAGTFITVEIPFSIPEPTEDTQKDGRGTNGGPAGREPLCGHALLVEDNELNREIAVELLQLIGITADCAENGRIAVDRFIAAPAGTYQVVLMDVQMPVMDGYSAARAIRACDHPDAKTAPIIAMTANAFQEDVAAALACGMDGHLAKPVDPDLLYQTLARQIRPRREGRRQDE